MKIKVDSNPYDKIDPTLKAVSESEYDLPEISDKEKDEVFVGPVVEAGWKAKEAEAYQNTVEVEVDTVTSTTISDTSSRKKSRRIGIGILIVFLLFLILLAVGGVLLWYFWARISGENTATTKPYHTDGQKGAPTMIPKTDHTDAQKLPVSPAREAQECGISPQIENEPGAYIINGEAAKQGAWPWYVRLNYRGYLQCGAVLVSNRWVMTSVYCTFRFVNYNETIAYVGMHNSNSTDPGIEIDRIVMHPEYVRELSTRGLWQDNIALLRLKSPVSFDVNTQAICLDSVTMVEQYKRCVFTGFGEEGYYVGGTSPLLLQGEMKPYGMNDCKAKYEEIHNVAMTANATDFERSFCAQDVKTPAASPCRGDGGGPLMCYGENKKWSLAGIFSFFVGPCQLHFFAKISYYTDWINQIINQP